MDLQKYFDSIGITVKSTLTTKCPADCYITTKPTKELLSTHPRLTHQHGRIYRVEFSRPNSKSITFDYVTKYQDERFEKYGKVFQALNKGPLDVLNAVQAGAEYAFKLEPLFRDVWYGSYSIRNDFYNFLSSYDYLSIDEVRKLVQPLTSIERIVQSVSVGNPGTFDEFCRREYYDSHRNLMYKYDRARKEFKRFQRFFSPEEIDWVYNWRENNR